MLTVLTVLTLSPSFSLDIGHWFHIFITLSIAALWGTDWICVDSASFASWSERWESSLIIGRNCGMMNLAASLGLSLWCHTVSTYNQVIINDQYWLMWQSGYTDSVPGARLHKVQGGAGPPRKNDWSFQSFFFFIFLFFYNRLHSYSYMFFFFYLNFFSSTASLLHSPLLISSENVLSHSSI